MIWINNHKISELGQEIGEENIPLLLEIFLSELGMYRQKLLDDVPGGNMSYLIEISHALKSSAASFGADQLCSVARHIDSNAKQGIAMDEEFETANMLDTLTETLKHYQQYYPALV